MTARINWVSELGKLHQNIDRTAATCTPAAKFTPAGQGRSKSQDDVLVDWSPLPAHDQPWELLRAAVSGNAGCSAAVGSLIGLAIGDAVGAPLEFLPVDPRPIDVSEQSTRPGLIPDPRGANVLRYRNEFNKFKLQRGQWTDDCSMALCLADTLLVHNEYHGGDARVRWHMWWTHGYNNAFRHDGKRPRRTSVGLGGNISTSLADVQRIAENSSDPAQLVPAVYGSTTADAGNGSIMRLAPVAIAFHKDEIQAMEVAALQSKGTHPSDDAAACSRFMAFFIARAICSHKQNRIPWRDPRRFMVEQIRDFLRASSGYKDDGTKLLGALLTCQPPGPNEANWNWKQETLSIDKALAARRSSPGGTYNGYPVSDAYFGSYCMDGLAMALWALWQSTDFVSCIVRAVNLLGDADTVGAIAGQMAGALYSWHGITNNQFSKQLYENFCAWDPSAEVGLRAALLYQHSPKPSVAICPGEGHRAVQMFLQPNVGTTLLTEIPSGTQAACADRRKDWALVRLGQKQGWVQLKHVVDSPNEAVEEEMATNIPASSSLRFPSLSFVPDRVVLQQSDGHPAVRVFSKPKSGAQVVHELPNGEQLKCVEKQGNFLRVVRGSFDGWIGVKNIAREVSDPGVTYV